MGSEDVELVRKTTWDQGNLLCLASCVFTQNDGHKVIVKKWFSLNQAELRSGEGKAGLKGGLARHPGFYWLFFTSLTKSL